MDPLQVDADVLDRFAKIIVELRAEREILAERIRQIDTALAAAVEDHAPPPALHSRSSAVVAVEAFVRSHPGARFAEILAAMLPDSKHKRSTLCTTIGTLARRGVLVVRGPRGAYRYYVATSEPR